MRRKNQQVHVRVVITALDPDGAVIEKHIAPSYRAQATENLRKKGYRILEHTPTPEEKPWEVDLGAPASPAKAGIVAAGEGLLWAVIGILCLIIVFSMAFVACGAAMSP